MNYTTETPAPESGADEVRVYADGERWWYRDGLLHREDGPAIGGSDGSRWWYLNGRRHREDGPAVEYADGEREWWLNGVKVTEGEWRERVGK